MAKQAIFEKKIALVTGGAGFIGSHLCDELIKTRKVICVDNFVSGSEKNIDHLLAHPNFEFIKHDINEPLNLESFKELEKFKIEFQGVQEIYNLACPTSPKHFDENKINILLSNSYGVKNMLDLALKYKAKFMQFSSSVVYGPRRINNTKILEEDLGSVDFLSQRSSYDEGKRFAETFVKNYHDVYNLDTKIVRIFRTYGPRMKLADGNMIPDFIDAALENRDIVIYGDEKFSSSFCYVQDVVEAVIKMMETDLTGPFNIGSDVDVNVTKLAQKIIEIIGSKSKIVYEDPLLFLTPLCLPDTTRARNELAWMPIITLENGLKKTIEDLRSAKKLLNINQVL